MDGRNVVSTVFGFVAVDCAELVMAEVPLFVTNDDVTINFDAILVDLDEFDITGDTVDCIAVLFVFNVVDAVDGTDEMFDRVVLMVDVPLVVPDVTLADVGVFVVEDFVDNFDNVLVIMVDVELFVADDFVVDGLIVDVACSVVDMVDGVLGRDVLMDEVPLVDLDVIVLDVKDFVVDDFVVTGEAVDWLDGLNVDVDCVVVEMFDDMLGRVVFIVDVPLVDPDVIMVVVKVFVVDDIVVMVGVVG